MFFLLATSQFVCILSQHILSRRLLLDMAALSRTKLSTIRQRLFWCCVLVMLSVEWANPVNLVAEVFLFPKQWCSFIGVAGFLFIMVCVCACVCVCVCVCVIINV